MLTGGPWLLSALCLLQAEVQLDVGARVETRVGQAPPITNSSQAEQAQVLVEATPIVNLHWFERGNDLRATAATRILWRPVPLFDSRPLFLETLNVSQKVRTSARTDWQLNLDGSIGEEDYTVLAQQLPNQPALPSSLTALMVSASTKMSWRTSRRSTLSLHAGVTHRRSLDTTTSTGTAMGSTSSPSSTGRARPILPPDAATTAVSPFSLILPTQTSVTAGPAMRHVLSQRSELNLAVYATDYDVEGSAPTTWQAGSSTADTLYGPLNILAFQPQCGLTAKLAPRQQLHVMVGLTYALRIRSPGTAWPWSPKPDRSAWPYAMSIHTPATSGAWHPLTPLAQIELNSQLLQARAVSLTSSFSASTSWYVDPVLGSTVLRGSSQADVNAQLGPAWTVGVRAGFATDLTGPLPPDAGGIPPDETVVSFSIPFRRLWRNHLVAEFGGRYTERAPHLASDRFFWHERELWAYLSLYTPIHSPVPPI